MNYASDQAGEQFVVDAITTTGGRDIATRADVAKCTDVARLSERAKKAFGVLDILVNNAGI